MGEANPRELKRARALELKSSPLGGEGGKLEHKAHVIPTMLHLSTGCSCARTTIHATPLPFSEGGEFSSPLAMSTRGKPNLIIRWVRPIQESSSELGRWS